MANITEFINKIKNAVYGKEVRDSIINAINAINVENSVTISSATINDGNLILSLTDGTTINCGNTKGTDGKSAYEIAVDGGYAGTEEAFEQALAGIEDGGIETVSDISVLPLSPQEGDLVYLEKTGKITTDFTKVPLQWALDTDDEITNKIYPKLYFNPRPDTSGMPAIEDFYFDVYADNPSITKESLEDDESLTEGRGIEIQVAPITDLDESYSGTDAVILVLSTDLITYKQTDYLYVPNDMFLPLEEDVAVYAKSGWNVLKTRLKGFSSGKPVYEYITVPRDEPPALSYGVIYHKSEYGDGFAEKITALAEILQPNPYYINLPAGVVGYFDGFWQGQDYLSGDRLSDDIRNLQADIAEIKGLIEGG